MACFPSAREQINGEIVHLQLVGAQKGDLHFAVADSFDDTVDRSAQKVEQVRNELRVVESDSQVAADETVNRTSIAASTSLPDRTRPPYRSDSPE
jgi:hypothetical protein